MEPISYGKWEIPVLHEDNHLLVVVKPANLPVQADSSGDMDLLSILKEYVGKKYNKPGKVFMGLVHRLDRPVGGVMVFARTSKAASRLSEQFSSHTVDKRYYAVVQGQMTGETQLSHDLIADEKTGMVRKARPNEPGSKNARLTSRAIASRNNLTLTEVRLETGRKHQIRVQHALSGFPLWGDARYGGGKSGQQIALWAHSLSFSHPTLKTDMHFHFPPESFGAWQTFSDILSEQEA
ncbi:MAG: RluA family pseudouridine synthase [Clostridia bacterium]|nr:RluA family pseudouridine synthase [Clostridia bacterium]